MFSGSIRANLIGLLDRSCSTGPRVAVLIGSEDRPPGTIPGRRSYSASRAAITASSAA